jgi:hypothetical protein
VHGACPAGDRMPVENCSFPACLNPVRDGMCDMTGISSRTGFRRMLQHSFSTDIMSRRDRKSCVTVSANISSLPGRKAMSRRGQVSCTTPCRVKDERVSASNFGTPASFSKLIKKHNLHLFRRNSFLFSKRQVTLQPNKIREQIGLTMTDIFSSRPNLLITPSFSTCLSMTNMHALRIFNGCVLVACS